MAISIPMVPYASNKGNREKKIKNCQWPQEFKWQPLQSGCRRVLVGDRYHLEFDDGTEIPQVPPITLKDLQSWSAALTKVVSTEVV